MSANLSVVRIISFLTTLHDFIPVSVEVNGTYIQSGAIQKEYHVRHSKHIDTRQCVVWRLLHVPYGTVEAGRKFLCAIEDGFHLVYQTDRTIGVEQLFHASIR